MDLYPDKSDASQTTSQVLTDQTYVEDTLAIAPPTLSLQGYLGPAGIDEPNPLLERQYLIHEFTFQDDDTEFFYPWADLRAVDQIDTLLSRYNLMRADVQVTIQLSCPITTYGLCFATPLYNMTVQNTQERYLDWRHIACAPDTVLLDVTRREMVKIVIPFISPFDYQPLHAITNGEPKMDNYMGIWLQSKNVTSIVPDVVNPYFDVQVWANFQNVSLAGPTWAQGQMEPHKPSKVLKTLGDTLQVLGSAAYTWGAPGAAELMASGEAAKTASAMCGQAETVIRQVQQAAAVMGVENEPEPYRIAPWGNLACMKYTQSQQFMGATKLVSLPEVPLEGPSHDFDLYSMCKLQNWLANGIYVKGQVYEEAVIPYNMIGWWPAVLDLFRRSRSSIKVHVRFFTSPLVTGRATITVDWDRSPNRQPGDNYTQVVAIQGTVDHFFTIPYVNFTHWRYTTEGTIFNYYLNPNLSIKIDELTSSTEPSSSPTVGLLVMCSAADDLVMQYPQSPFWSEGHMNLSTTHATSSLFPSISGSIPPVVDKPDVTHALELLNRFSLSYKQSFTVSNFVETPLTEAILPLAYPTTETGTFDWLVYNMCRFTSGSKRFKVEMDTAEEDLVMINSWTSAEVGDASFDIYYRPFDGITRTYNGIWQILEFEVPFAMAVSMLPVYEVTSPPDGIKYFVSRTAPIAGVVDPTVVSSSNNVLKAYTAAGHDFRMHVLSPPPRLIKVLLAPPPP